MAGAGQKRKRAETARMLASWPFHARSQVSQNPRDLGHPAQVFVMKKGGSQDWEVEHRLLTDRRCGCAEIRS